jgi:hypothetical protein
MFVLMHEDLLSIGISQTFTRSETSCVFPCCPTLLCNSLAVAFRPYGSQFYFIFSVFAVFGRDRNHVTKCLRVFFARWSINRRLVLIPNLSLSCMIYDISSIVVLKLC